MVLMTWRGKDLETWGDLGSAIVAICRDDDQDAADEFMRIYSATSEHAASNVGYLAGYYDPETMRKIWRMFKGATPYLRRRLMPSQLTLAKVDMYEAGIAYYEAAKAAILSLDSPDNLVHWTLEARARDKHATYLRMCERVSEAVEAIRTARGRPAERRPPEEHEEDPELFWQERRDLQEGAPRP